MATYVGKFGGYRFGHLTRRRYRIPGEEIAAAEESAIGACLIAQPKIGFALESLEIIFP